MKVTLEFDGHNFKSVEDCLDSIYQYIGDSIPAIDQ